MAYHAIQQHEGEGEDEYDLISSHSGSCLFASPTAVPAPPSMSPELFLDGTRQGQLQHQREEHKHQHQHQHQHAPLATSSSIAGALAQKVHSGPAHSRIASGSSYEMVESDDLDADAPSSSTSPNSSRPYPESGARKGSSASPSNEASAIPLHIPRPRPRPNPATGGDSLRSPTIPQAVPIVRTASQCAALRHPTPDLQTLQGAYTGNIALLERTAERLSMTSSIDDAIKDLHDEQKRSDSRRSSLLSQQGVMAVSRKMSNASSIVEVNSAARSGGYSPAGFMMSPRGSFKGRNRSASNLSKGSKFGTRPEPEMEGRPLDSVVALPSITPMSPTASIAEQDEGSATLTRPIAEMFSSVMDIFAEQPEEQPTKSVASSIYDQQFADFDGVHNDGLDHVEAESPQSERDLAGDHLSQPPQRRLSFGDELNDHPQRRISFGNDLNSPERTQLRSVSSRLSMASNARPQSYADPQSGQQMVFYPAPVPAMLNLPQKLSKNPSSMARNKRRSQVMSNIPQTARQSAIWLPDVLEDEPDYTEDLGIHQHEYVPQHQRMTMGGRRSTQDPANLPPQLRASVFFDLPEPAQKVELKEQSAVATLDSILDASAHAPVSAFTDHAYAGALGAEVYGKALPKRASRSSTQLLAAPTSMPKKRTSSFNLLRRRTASTSDLEADIKDQKRASTLSINPNGIRTVLDDEDEDESKDTDPLTSEKDAESRVVSGEFNQDLQDEPSEHSEEEGEEEEEEPQYHGAPTTLLAELQLRKQQQKQRTKQTFPNGMHSTLLQLDAVAQVEAKSRKQKKVTLAWEDPTAHAQLDEEDDDEDVPLAMLYSKKAAEANRPLGLMERREMEDNEPLSRRRDRLQGKPPQVRTVSMLDRVPTPEDPEEEGETLAQRIRRLKEQDGPAVSLPAARPVSGDFASEMMSQFGGDLTEKPKTKEKEVPPEEETLGQRRKRLQAEREAREREFGNPQQTESRPPLNSRRSMADILQAHPQANSQTSLPTYGKPVGGLLSLHEQAKQKRPSLENRRSSTLLHLESVPMPQVQSRAPSGGFKSGMYNDGQGGMIPQQPQAHRQSNLYPQFAQPSLAGFGGNGFGSQQNMVAYQNPYIYNPNTMGMNNMGMGLGMGMGMNMNMNMNMYNPMMMGSAMHEPANQGQIDMVERWRQSVMQ